MQKRVIRIISKSTFDSHSDPIFKELELLKLSDIRQLELGKLMFSVSFQGPTYYNSIENDIKESHSLAPIIQNEIEKIYIYELL